MADQAQNAPEYAQGGSGKGRASDAHNEDVSMGEDDDEEDEAENSDVR